VVNHPGGLATWLARKQPPLHELMTLAFADGDVSRDAIKMIVTDFHSVIHADPAATNKFLSLESGLGFVWSADRTYGLDAIVDEISTATLAAVRCLDSNLSRAFGVEQ